MRVVLGSVGAGPVYGWGMSGSRASPARPQRWYATKWKLCPAAGSALAAAVVARRERRPQFLQRKSSGKRLTSTPESDWGHDLHVVSGEQVVGEAAVGSAAVQG